MTIRAVSDTHAIIWYVYGDARLSATARTVFDTAGTNGEQIGIASISLVEIVYLAEKDRIPDATLDGIFKAFDDPNPLLRELPLDRTIVTALRSIDRGQIPELADRIIAATAYQLGVPVISRDRKIAASTITTIW